MSEVKFLTTNDILAGIERIISESKKYLYIISPYLQIDGNIKRRLEDGSALKGVEVHLVYRKDWRDDGKGKKARANTEEWLTTVPWVKAHVLERLHAKCYLNEKDALVTSINLYDYSTRNVETGVLVSMNDGFLGSFGNDVRDTKLYDDILKHAQEIVSWSEDAYLLAKPTSATQEHKPAPTKTKESTSDLGQVVVITERGACIRCGDEIGAAPSKPFCRRHWKYWNKEKYNDHLQKFCHLCGKGDGVTRLKPACYPCYRKNKDIYEWPAA